jgi:hypothetical protein
VAEGPSHPGSGTLDSCGANGVSLRGIALFSPTFPGAFPFRAGSPDDAFALLRAMKHHARPEDEMVGLVTEDQPAIAEALLRAGATLRVNLLHMRAPL